MSNYPGSWSDGINLLNGNPLVPDYRAGTLDTRASDRALGWRLMEGRASYARGLGDQTANNLYDAVNQALIQRNANR